MTLDQFQQSVADGRAGPAIDQLYEGLEEIFFSQGIKALNGDQKAVMGIASFIGQTRNGGFETYLDTPWAAFLPDLESLSPSGSAGVRGHCSEAAPNFSLRSGGTRAGSFRR